MIELNYIEVTQPIGSFYMSSIEASTLLRIVSSCPRSQSQFGVQRDISSRRITEIRDYCSDPDAVFPTPIVISINKNADVVLDETNHKIIFNDCDHIIGEVIDGQHRLRGIGESTSFINYTLPVVFMSGLTTEEKAYVFSTINSNQTKVDPSLIFDLFDVSKIRSPRKTVHDIARAMNYNEDSPFYNKLKMLGKKTQGQDFATLSQGTFANSILMLISKKPDKDALLLKKGEPLKSDKRLPFREMFIKNKDEIIIKILLNCFNALRRVFYEEWSNPQNNILWKTTGFRGIIYALSSILQKGLKEKVLNENFFVECFIQFKQYLNEKNIQLTSNSFPGGGEQNQKRLAKMIIDCISERNPAEYFTNLTKCSSYIDLIDSMKEVSNQDIYNIYSALYTQESNTTCLINKEEDKDSFKVIDPFSNTYLECNSNTMQHFMSYIKEKYMNGMNIDEWAVSNNIEQKETTQKYI